MPAVAGTADVGRGVRLPGRPIAFDSAFFVRIARRCANNWQLARLAKRKSSDPVVAAAAAMLGLLWNPAEISTYDVAFFDGDGAPLDGFWSVTMYSAENQLFVPNAIDRYSFGDRTPGIVYGADGSLEIFLQHEESTDPVERANWLPAPTGPFYLVTRHYSPRPPILTGDWVPPPVIAR